MKSNVLTVLALACALATGAAVAKNDDAPGQQKKHQDANHQKAKDKDRRDAPSGTQTQIHIGAVFGDADRQAVQGYYGQRYSQAKGCPPGLAKKNNGCLPPGQAKKYMVGQPLPAGTVWYAVPQPLVTRLPPLPVGRGYVRVGADILVMDRKSRLVIDVAAAFPL